MKKLLLSLFVVLFAMSAKATEVVFDFDNNATALFGIEGRSSSESSDGDITENAVAELDGVVLTVSPSTTNTPNRLWTTSPVLRMYGGTITLSASEHKITKIEFVSNNKFSIASVSEGELNDKIWTGDASSVVITIKANTQLKSLTVTLDGESGDTPPTVEIGGTGEGTIDSPYDVERALSLIANGKQTTDNVYVAGTVSEIQELSTQFGNCTYYLANADVQILVYRGKSLDNKAFTDEAELSVNDELVICGVLKDYNGIPEITGSYIYSLNGQTAPDEPEYVPVGNGSKENPYTVDDVIGLDILTADGQNYWVKGIILGSASSATSLNPLDKAVDTNLALGMSADATTFVPVQLPAGEMRTILGVATNPDNVGKEVMVYGTLEKYYNVAGVKNVSACVLDGKETTGIDNIANDNQPVRYYNIQGIEVANPQPGSLYIRVQGNKATKVIK